MADESNVFIERRAGEGDFAIRLGNSDRASAVELTQEAAIKRPREMHPNAAIHVERVRDVPSGSPDKWHKVE